MLLYRLFLLIYRFGIGLSAVGNDKAKKWIEGRKDWRRKYADLLPAGQKRIWIHCASLGEYEQAKPLIALLKAQYSDYNVVLTFFSPSGFEAYRKSDFVDYVFYLPLDSKSAARDFIGIVRPSLVLFVKYEFWYYYLSTLKSSGVPVLLVAAAFRGSQPFFKWYGGFFRNVLNCFTHIHVQDEASAELLRQVGISDNVSVTGDTRYDRVGTIAETVHPIPIVDKFKGDGNILIAGSTWPDDENALQHCVSLLPDNWKMIIAPHEVDAGHVRQVLDLFGGDAVLFSELEKGSESGNAKVLIIDNIGMLSRLYAYGTIAYVGGGFQKGGIHNVLEPAVFGLPVVIGPVYEKFVEAVRLVSLGAVIPIGDAAQAVPVVSGLISNEQLRLDIKKTLTAFMRENLGASKRVISQILMSHYI